MSYGDLHLFAAYPSPTGVLRYKVMQEGESYELRDGTGDLVDGPYVEWYLMFGPATLRRCEAYVEGWEAARG